MEVGKLLENGLTGGLEAARCLPCGHAKPRVKLQLVKQDGTHLVRENFLFLVSQHSVSVTLGTG